jgi:hypothetical protein
MGNAAANFLFAKSKARQYKQTGALELPLGCLDVYSLTLVTRQIGKIL